MVEVAVIYETVVSVPAAKLVVSIWMVVKVVPGSTLVSVR